jgi:hypothetical protein
MPTWSTDSLTCKSWRPSLTRYEYVPKPPQLSTRSARKAPVSNENLCALDWKWAISRLLSAAPVTGDTKNAMLWFRQAYASSPSVYTCFNLIVLADEIGDTATRDEAIRLLLTNYRRQGPVACRIYEILRRSLHEGAAGSVDLEAVDAILQSGSPPRGGRMAPPPPAPRPWVTDGSTIRSFREITRESVSNGDRVTLHPRNSALVLNLDVTQCAGLEP